MGLVFEFSDYKSYLRDVIERGPKQGWGLRSKMAEAVGCQSAYFSRVVGGDADLSLEQAEALTHFLHLSEEEADFFLLLVEHARAGSAALRSRFQRRISQVVNHRLVLKNRFKVKTKMTTKDQATYYSAWYYTAVHVMLSVPGYQTVAAISEALDLSPAKVNAILDFLLSVGLAREEKNKYLIGETRIHVGANSPELNKHLLNWRLRAMQKLDQQTKQELHYTGIVSLSRADAMKIREILVKAIESANSVVAASPEEIVQCISVDFFSAVRG